MNTVAKAMKSIDGARRHHDQTCRYKGVAVEVHMNPDDAERIGFDDGEQVCGLTLKRDEKVGVGRIRVYCDAELDGQGPPPEEVVDARSTHTLTKVGA